MSVLAAVMALSMGAATPRLDAAIEVVRVLVPVVVLDRHGRPVAGLEKSDFALEVDGKAVEIENFEGGDTPFSIALVIDASASMIGGPFEAARSGARALIERLGPRDRAAVMTFDHRARVLLAPTSDRAALLAAVAEATTGGGTAVYDALSLAIQVLEPEPGRKAVILLSDGQDAVSRSSPAAVEQQARRSQVVLYDVTIAQGPFRPDPDDGGRLRLARLAEDTGGRALRPASLEELLASYVDVCDEMRNQYTLTFVPAGGPDGRWHPIEVKLHAPGARLRARRGFQWSAP